MRNSAAWWLVLGFIILIDVYVYFAVRPLFQTNRSRNIFAVIYFSISVLGLGLLLLLPYLSATSENFMRRSTIFAVIFALFFGKIAAAIFFFIDDVRRLAQWVIGRFFTGSDMEVISGAGNGISRSVFLTWLGIAAGGGLFATFVHGFGNKYNYRVRRLKLSFENLPQAFKGLKVIQLSDIHSGSFNNLAAVNKGIDMVLNEKPDVILFTGDLVNSYAHEMKNYTGAFARLQAPMGVYSILGNHDYGDYARWDSLQAKENNLETLKQIHAKMGWRLLLDEHLPLQKNGATIGLIGVQNISGKANFHSYGNMQKAMAGANAYPFKILMSHDPSHWDSEVNTKYYDAVDLMLSGHTHGMQFGVELPWFKWSPVKYVYKQWAGLYEKGKQKLYVNRGFGFIGYPGRVGILPEITVIELA